MSIKNFKLYSAYVSPSAPNMAVRPSRIFRRDMTAAEIAILLSIHGVDAVDASAIIEQANTLDVDEPTLRDMLARVYDTVNVDGKKILAEAFGAFGTIPVDITQIMSVTVKPDDNIDEQLAELAGKKDDSGRPREGSEKQKKVRTKRAAKKAAESETVEDNTDPHKLFEGAE